MMLQFGKYFGVHAFNKKNKIKVEALLSEYMH